MTEEEIEHKQNILLDTLDDSMSCFLYYDRKEDEDLSVEDIEVIVTVEFAEKMIQRFRENLLSGIQ
jgi:hypothetical protein